MFASYCMFPFIGANRKQRKIIMFLRVLWEFIHPHLEAPPLFLQTCHDT